MGVQTFDTVTWQMCLATFTAPLGDTLDRFSELNMSGAQNSIWLTSATLTSSVLGPTVSPPNHFLPRISKHFSWNKQFWCDQSNYVIMPAGGLPLVYYGWNPQTRRPRKVQTERMVCAERGRGGPCRLKQRAPTTLGPIDARKKWRFFP